MVYLNSCTWTHLCVYIVYMSKNVKCAAWKVSLTSKLLTETEWHLCLSAGLGVCRPQMKWAAEKCDGQRQQPSGLSFTPQQQLTM